MNDPYLYDNVNILKNKFNIKDKEILNQMEAEFTYKTKYKTNLR